MVLFILKEQYDFLKNLIDCSNDKGRIYLAKYYIFHTQMDGH